MIITTGGPQNVGQILTHFKMGNLFLSPEEYQRENAWTMAQKQLLIDSIFRGLDIPKFYLWKIDQWTLVNGYTDGDAKSTYRTILDRKRLEHEIADPYIFEVVDGQQRIRTILEFMGVTPPNDKCYRGMWHEPFTSSEDTPMAKGKRYSQLTAEQQIEFGERRLTVMVLEKATIDEVRDMFLRLQSGTPLNAQQKRDAMGANIGRAARELSTLPFFTKSVNFDNTWSTHHLVASQMLQLELKGNIVSCTSQQLDKLYKHYKQTSIDTGVVSRVKVILGILGRIFPEKNRYLNQNYALSLYWLLSRILVNYDIPVDQYPKIRQNFEQLDISRLEAMSRDYERQEDEMYEELSLSMSRGNLGSEGITKRHNVIGQFLFDGVNLQERPALDPRRNFTHEEKLILYHRANGYCQLEHNGEMCGRSIQFDEAVVDHIIPHSRGGKTELPNGRIAYSSCNNARGSGDDFNPETDCHLFLQNNEPIEETI